VARFRGQLFVCATGCCCGRTGDGFAAVSTELYHGEWERRRLRNVVHLTIGGCLGPCALANVALLLFDGQAQWFHTIDSDALVRALYDHIDAMLAADGCLAPPASLAPHHFTASTWQARPDGQAVDDFRPRQRVVTDTVHASDGPALDAAACHSAPTGAPVVFLTGSDVAAAACHASPAGEPTVCDAPLATTAPADGDATATRLHALLADLGGVAAVPRRNGELVFDEPWQGRVFGMAVALSEQGRLPWEEFRQALIAEIAAAEARGGEFRYYHAWLAAFERVLAARGAVRPDELEETTFQFEFGERDEVY
jgi:nitrile hydratase accessory protein